LVDRCIISSSWNVFDPGAAHTAKTRKKSYNTFKYVQFSYISNGFSTSFSTEIQKPFDKDEEKAVVTTSFD